MMNGENWRLDGQLRPHLLPTTEISFGRNDQREDFSEFDALFAPLFAESSASGTPASHDAAAAPPAKDKHPAQTSLATNAAPTNNAPATTHADEKVSPPPKVSYAFPHQDGDYQLVIETAKHKTTAELIDALAATISGLDKPFTAGNHLRGYLAVRARTCALAIVLNHRQALPPTLREWINLRKVSGTLTDEQKIASNDLQVIDLHWLHASGVRPVAPKAVRVFDDRFNFDEAAVFVATMGRLENKVTLLGLTEQEMLLLKMLRTPAVRERQRNIRNTVEERRGAIRAALKDPKCRLPCTEAEMVQSYHALLLADGDPTHAAVVAHQAFRLEISKQTMARRKKWLSERKLIHTPRPISTSAH